MVLKSSKKEGKIFLRERSPVAPKTTKAVAFSLTLWGSLVGIFLFLPIVHQKVSGNVYLTWWHWKNLRSLEFYGRRGNWGSGGLRSKPASGWELGTEPFLSAIDGTSCGEGWGVGDI